ncbi:MAG: hypothetical protein OIN66_16965 [Candidatus Methanoperedens sp.]|nr:hypothetical protein [Candidatus Methanoperedens sp.]
MTGGTQQQDSKKEPAKNAADEGKQSSPVPSISLPKGGGAIRGIGEKFAANPVTGTGSMTVPIFTSPGRSGFGPQLSLSYDSGLGNGPFGFGWSLPLPSITRKTDKGLPKYQDASESDVFILSGAEDLVPVLVKEGGIWIRKPIPTRTINGKTYRIDLYRPRIEGLFARIERWTSECGDVHWRSISKDNIITVYGRDNNSRIFDPADESRIFSWLICESYDDKGNAIVYEYEPENENGIDLSQTNEIHRLRTANKYLKRIKCGNRKPLLIDTNERSFRISHIVQPDFDLAEWMFEVVLDYGEGHYAELDDHFEYRFQASAIAGRTWKCRPDPFSTYRAGFEVRTYRRCQRVLMFHHFPELGSEPCLVRSTEFNYNDMDYSQPVVVETELEHKGSTRFASFIQSVTQSGYVRDETRPLYLKKSLPPLEFEYSQAVIQDEIKTIEPSSLENLPEGVDGTRYQWVDLDGEGLSGILTEQGGAWFYKPNLGDGEFGSMETVASRPSPASLSGGNTQLLDLAGDGQLDVVEFGGTVPGFYERTHDRKWENFIPFESLPNISWKDPNLRFVDLTGDGHADVMITEDEVFTWYPSLAEEGFGLSEEVRQALDEEKGPRLVFDDGTQSIFLADFSGDGLTDLVRIRNGEVCYWPNLGYGRFGARVTMDNAPWFDHPDQFDQKRIRLADVDGSGVTDIIYLGHDGVQIYFNHSGNSWSGARTLTCLPHIDNFSSIQVADLFGNGTACLVWSSPLPCDSGRPMLFIDLMGKKPHLLERSNNNMGAKTAVTYAASTKFYLKDKKDGKPWITRIPFPVHVVERVETYDRISRNRFVTRYAYHHGYFDGIEREFRGFGMVEQCDTEEMDYDGAAAERDDTNWDEGSFVPPVLTRTWFHTGAYFEDGIISKQFEGEYYREGNPGLGEGELSEEQLKAMLLPDTVLPDHLSSDEVREACRSLKGSILRQEIYARERRPDGTLTEKSDRPYKVSERNYTIECLQPRGTNKHAVFFTHARETVDFHYERKLFAVNGDMLVDPISAPDARKASDPRVTHSLTLAVDEYGNVLRSVAVGYGRRFKDPGLSLDDQRKQEETLITFTENRYTNDVLEEDAYRAPLILDSRTFEVFKVQTPSAPPGVTPLFKFEFLNGLVESADFSNGSWDINYEDITHTGAREDHAYRRLIEHVRTVYRKNNLTGLSEELESLALPGETYKLAFTPDLLTAVFGTRTNDSMFTEGGYVHFNGDANWWIPSGQVFYDPDANVINPDTTAAAELAEACANFFLPRKFTDPFRNSTTIDYDKPHDLLMVRTEDAVRNVVRADNDYRVLQPRLVTDPNGNRSKAKFDALGMVVGTAVMGKETENLGDPMIAFEADITLSDIRRFIENPRDTALDLIKDATTRIIYDIDRFLRCGQPPFAATLAREIHSSDTGGDESPIQISFSYSDGFGREIQKKIQAESGKAPEREADDLSSGDIRPGRLVLEDGKPEPTATDHRWVGKGRTVFNNKGKPVKQYEPFFSSTHLYEEEREMTDTGVTIVLFYDPVERVICTLHPNHTYEKVVFDPWHQKTYDVNDTVATHPRTDPDISDYVEKYFKQVAPVPEDWKTWLQKRDVDPNAPPEDLPGLDPEKKAAVRTLVHADTPTVAYLDTLGRTFLTVAHNKFERRTNGSFTPIDEEYRTRVVLDIEGNQREVIDAKDRIVMQYDYDMLGSRIHQSSMEAGKRWTLNDVTGKPIRAWDSRGFQRRMTYDALRRPVGLFVTDSTGAEFLAEETEYGESKPNPEITNHRLKPWKVKDGAGILVSDSYDFKGNLLITTRQLLPDYRSQVNWGHYPSPETETFASRTTYDALNRPIQIIAPHSNRAGTKLNVIQPVYNEANLLEREDVWLEQVAEPDGLLPPGTATHHAVTNIDYNEKGQRVLIQYGNGAETRYKYDPETFRLSHLYTRRGAAFTRDCGGDGNDPPPPLYASPEKPTEGKQCGLQNIHYTYDPIGNIVVIRDDAQQTIYFDGQVVRPDAEYKYDAIYRLIQAKGREHIGQASIPNWNDGDRVNLAHPHNGQAMRNFCELYEYDEVGNFSEFKHYANSGSWIRTYDYIEESLVETGMFSNRLSSTTVRGDKADYKYDEHGNMTRMQHFANHSDPEQPNMYWDFEDQLQMVDKGGGTIAYYVYDAAGERVRKVVEKNSGNIIEERIYLGGFEVYRKYSGGNPDPELERESLHIMDDKQRIALVDTKTIDIKNRTIVPETLIRYQHGNHLGSASLELDENSEVISYEEYYPYGSTSYQAARSSVEVSTKRYRYTGKERDEETGLYYYGARYYAPWVGRWVSCDPAGDVDGKNLFLYAKGSPVTLTDIIGTQTVRSEKSEIELPDNAFDFYDQIGVQHIEFNFEDQGLIDDGKDEGQESIDINIVSPQEEDIDIEEIYTAGDIAIAWEKQYEEASKILDEWISGNPNLGKIAIATMLQSAMDLGRGFVDMLKLGEGTAEGGWGVGKDVLRAIGLAAPMFRVFSALKAGSVASTSTEAFAQSQAKLLSSASTAARNELQLVTHGGPGIVEIAGQVRPAQALADIIKRANVSLVDLIACKVARSPNAIQELTNRTGVAIRAYLETVSVTSSGTVLNVPFGNYGQVAQSILVQPSFFSMQQIGSTVTGLVGLLRAYLEMENKVENVSTVR